MTLVLCTHTTQKRTSAESLDLELSVILLIAMNYIYT